jgi:hypothetical protein
MDDQGLLRRVCLGLAVGAAALPVIVTAQGANAAVNPYRRLLKVLVQEYRQAQQNLDFWTAAEAELPADAPFDVAGEVANQIEQIQAQLQHLESKIEFFSQFG